MTRDDIMRMANAAELCQSIWIDEAGDDTVESVIRFAQLVAAAEREECLSILQDLRLSRVGVTEATRARG